MYRHIGCEYLFRDETGRLFSLELASPLQHETEEEAGKEELGLRFAKNDDEIKLEVFSREWQLIRSDDKGRSITYSLPGGERIAEYSYSEFRENLNNKIKRYVPPCEGGKKEFEKTDASFEDLFPGMENGQTIRINTSPAGYIAES